MNWANPPGTEHQPGDTNRLSQETSASPSSGHPSQAPEIRIDKSIAHSALPAHASSPEVFKMTLGSETIELIPLKNWIQLDHYKWTARGKLPAEPAGLEVALDHVKISGESVALSDPAGCAKLERLFNNWLQTEKATLEVARKKAYSQPHGAGAVTSEQRQQQPLRFRVEVDKLSQVHIHCVQGKETLESIGLTVAGFTSLIQQGLMRKPHALKTGVLHDWVELDGELCSFEKGRNEAARLEQLLNERYVPIATVGTGKEVVMFLNPASSTGFDIQFPVRLGGVLENHRQHWDQHSVELLQDQDHCGLLHKGLIVKLIPPNLVFKQKTPDGGEQYLSRGPEHTVSVTDADGHQKTFDLSQPISFMRLSPAELSGIFNHPAINRHAQPPATTATSVAPHPAPAIAAPASPPQPAPPRPASSQPWPQSRAPMPPPAAPPRVSLAAPIRVQPPKPAEPPTPLPNLWLQEILAQPALPPEWFTPLLYSKMALHFGNSNEGAFGPGACWFITLGESSDINDPAFKGIFLTEKGGLGFLNAGHMARFYHGVAFVGLQEAALEGIHISLVAVGLDAGDHVVFVVNENFRGGFDDPETTVADTLIALAERGAVLKSVTEILASPEPIEIVWTVPAEQTQPSNPEALESTRPTS